LPSHATLFTAQLPRSHGVESDTFALPNSAVLLTEVLAEQGYRTGGFVSWTYLGERFGFRQGFETFRQMIDLPNLDRYGGGKGALPAARVVDAAIDWIEQAAGRDDRPFFLFVHLFDPHLSYAAPAPHETFFDPDYDGPADGSYEAIVPFIRLPGGEPNLPSRRDLEHIVARYDGEIRYTDQEIGRLLAALDEAVDRSASLVAVVSDHGEEFGEHGSMEGHGWTLYEEVLRVPWLMRLPSQAHAGMVIEQSVGLRDVAPTLLDAVGIAAPEGFEGRSRLAEIDGAPASDDPVVAQLAHFGRLRHSLLEGQRKLIFTRDLRRDAPEPRTSYELFDLGEDPGEQRDLWDPRDLEAIRMAQRLEAAAEAPRGRASRPPAEAVLSAEEQELLRSLGYLE